MMPRLRRQAKSRRRLTLADIGISDMLHFMSGWHPPENDFERSRSPWQTLEDVREVWEQVREEFLEKFPPTPERRWWAQIEFDTDDETA